MMRALPLLVVGLAACGFRGHALGSPDDGSITDGTSSDATTPSDGVALDGQAVDGSIVIDAFVPAVVARYNIGGAAYVGTTDYPGSWAADPGNICTGTISNLDANGPISGTVDDALFQKQRYGIPLVTCQVAVANGDYSVTLLFGPIYYGGGANPTCMFPTTHQVFSIAIEGTTVASNYDLTADAGGCVLNGSTAKPITKTYPVSVGNGMLEIKLDSTDQNQASMISALQVLTAP